MPIINIQRRVHEAGRIRIGQQVPTGRGTKTRPEKLTTFRLTSPDRTKIEQAAAVYGGEPAEWDAPAGRQWEVVTATDTLRVIVPPAEMAFSQWFEQWSAGGCLRRCDGQHEQITDGPCLCDPDQRECDIHTRLSVMLADLPGLGVWRIDTSGYYAAIELSGAVQVVQAAAARGTLLPARLRLEQRTVKRQVEGKPQTRRFAVPVLDIDITPAQLLGGVPPQVEVDRPAQPHLTPVPDTMQIGPGQSIAEQATPPPLPPRRANAAPEIPRSGRVRRETPPVADTQPSEAQTRKMFALLREVGCPDRDSMLAYVVDVIGHPIGSSKELTRAEVSHVIDAVQEEINSQEQSPAAVAAFDRQLQTADSLPVDGDDL